MFNMNKERGRMMIYTVTLNPAVDYFVTLNELHLGDVNELEIGATFVGGKGINVSRVLARLAVPSVALGFIGGFTGTFITEQLTLEGIGTSFTTIAGQTRINIKIKSAVETELNGRGPDITNAELERFMVTLADIGREDSVIFAGSAPAALGNVTYEAMISVVKARGAQVVCDFAGRTLLQSLAHEPLLVKPNKAELAALYGVSLMSVSDIVTYGAKLRYEGAQNVIVSLADAGAVLLTDSDVYFAKPITGRVQNSVGAGDSMVAGFVGSFVRSGDIVLAFKTAVAAGSASAFSADLTTGDFITALLPQVEIEKM